VNSYFIIDQDSKSIEAVNTIFNGHSSFNFAGQFDKHDEAMNAILEYVPTIIFLDLDTTLKQPLSFVKEINCYTDKPPFIIGLSSSKKRAYEVIKMGFLDYLLKPLNELDVRKTLIRSTTSLISNQSISSTVCLRSYKDYQYLNTKEILFLKADNNTTDFHMKDGNIISAYKTLKTFESLLPDNFLRIHKSYIINSEFVSRINYGKLVCSISTSSFNIPFTKTYINNVESINKALSQSSLVSLN